MVARLALAAALAFTAGPIAAQESEAEDPYIWLEEIQGERALAKVDQWNAETEAVLTAQAEYPLAKAWARQILDDTRQIAMPDAIMGDQVTNLWRDADNPRGLWRTATLQSYLAGAPEWRTLIDVDQLGEDEGQSWVWHGANCLAPDYTRCLVSLSPGGTDADVVREFDITTGAFVEGGFTLPEAKSNVAWYDENTLFVGTDEGAGSLTDSGYPRLVKLWERGTDFAQARLIAEGEQTDISMNGFSVLDGETRYRFVRRGPDFWTGEYSLVAKDGATTALPLPVDAEFEAVLDGYVIAKLNSALDTPAGTEQPGALLAWSLDDVQRGRDAAPFAVFRPSETQAVEQVAASENKLWVKVLDDVSGKLIELTPGSDGWSARTMDLPGNSTIQIAETSGTGDTAFVTVESMLTPPTLYAVPSGVVDSRLRATAVAVTLFIVNLLGYGLGPPLIGGLSTILNATFLSGLDPALTLEACKASNLGVAAQAACDSANADGLQWSMVLFKCLYIWAVFHFYMASRTIQRDMGR